MIFFIIVGNSTLNFNATGISNVGKVHLNLDIGDGSINVPGLNNLFNGMRHFIHKYNKSFQKCVNCTGHFLIQVVRI